MENLDIIQPRVNNYYHMKNIIIFVRSTIYVSLGRVNTLIGRGKSNLIILCYHSVSDNGWRFSVDAEELDQQLKYLMTNFRVISLGTLYKHLTGKINITEPSVVVTF